MSMETITCNVHAKKIDIQLVAIVAVIWFFNEANSTFRGFQNVNWRLIGGVYLYLREREREREKGGGGGGGEQERK